MTIYLDVKEQVVKKRGSLVGEGLKSMTDRLVRNSKQVVFDH